jgi:hypothetical protein
VLGAVASQGIYTELYEKLFGTFATSLISFEHDKVSILRESCFKVRTLSLSLLPYATWWP